MAAEAGDANSDDAQLLSQFTVLAGVVSAVVILVESPDFATSSFNNSPEK